jgi:uncharacterized protein (TIGR02145 family)
VIIRIFITSCILFSAFILSAQPKFETDELRDTRDGKIYQTVKINNKIWLAENMRFVTEEVSIFNPSNSEAPTELYYYPYEEAGQVCPDGFGLPLERDWDDYMSYWLELNEISDTILHARNVFINGKNEQNGLFTAHNVVLFFEGLNPLNLGNNGFVENNKLVFKPNNESITFWTRQHAVNDDRYHVHIFEDGAVNHTHDYAITSRKRKKRKFVVRCVQQVPETKG